MTSTIAVTGKSGSGKSTAVYCLANLLKEKFKDKSILLVDNDLTGELAGFFGITTDKTIYGIRSGKHEYNTGIPSKMTKQEYIEWALEDILIEVDSNIDIIVSWLVASKDCRCPITKQMNDALVKLVERYDFVVFDCEYDLSYLHQLVDFPIDTTLLILNSETNSVELAHRLFESSKKYASQGQFGVILNKIKNETTNKLQEALSSIGLTLLGVIPDFGENIDKESFKNALSAMYTRLNLPQG
ncbi:MAG: AAA family ATPase [Candidatus Gastranaerophilales bacterium]|nr:AAA family ATPase [Candidatus Gastranaerophilales bacterium]